ncbi:MAG: ORF6N domain-containing protein [Sulfurimonas sp.]
MGKVLFEEINSKIYRIRGQKILLANDLALFYGVTTSYLNRQVKRNYERFDEEDFMFQLTQKEFDDLRSQNGTANFSKVRTLPFAFTEQGVYMLATVINSPVAVSVNKNIMRTFTKLREFSLHYNALAKKIIELERKNDKQFKEVFIALDDIVSQTIETDEKVMGFIKPK